MNRLSSPAIAVVAGLIALVIYMSLLVVDQRQRAVVLQFGALVKVIDKPGLNLIWPWQSVRVFDKRIQPIETDAEEVILSEKQARIVVDTFARYQITDPVSYIRGSPSDEAARQRLMSLLNSAVRDVLGRQNLNALLSVKRGELMHEIRDAMQAGANELGIQIVDVRIRRADLPEKNEESVFQRMQAARKQEAEKYRAEGDSEAVKITSRADKEATIIRAEATRKSEILRGEGDAERNRILGDAYGRDPEFFTFYRSLKAYEQSMNGGNTTMVITPDSPFFKYFRKGQTGR